MQRAFVPSSVLIQKGLQVASAVQHLDNPKPLLLRQIAVVEHVLGETRNKYPSQPGHSRRAEVARRTALRQAQQGIYS